LDALTGSLIIKALDGLSERASATAENIANASTPHYRPLRVSFERALSQAASQGPEAVRGVRPEMTRAPAKDGDMRLDLEVQTAASTALRYSALIDVLGRQMELESLAVTGGP
jgi:flagellar basal-body rod protein FlgB